MVGRQEGHPACKKTEWWGAGVVICMERGADLHMAQRMPLPLTVSCFSKIQIGFTFLIPAHPGSLGKRVVKRMCVCVCMYVLLTYLLFVLQQVRAMAIPPEHTCRSSLRFRYAPERAPSPTKLRRWVTPSFADTNVSNLSPRSRVWPET